jgi:hypothetical protein
MNNNLTLIRKEVAYKDSLWVSINPYEIELFNDHSNNGYLIRTTNPKGEIVSNIRTKNYSYAWELLLKIESRLQGYKDRNLELMEHSRRVK